MNPEVGNVKQEAEHVEHNWIARHVYKSVGSWEERFFVQE